MRKAVLVSGLVQGVGFRWAARDEAARLGVTGWIRNRADGSVQAEIEAGDDAVAAMLDWLRSGPPGSRVTGLDVAEVPGREEPDFRIVR